MKKHIPIPLFAFIIIQCLLAGCDKTSLKDFQGKSVKFVARCGNTLYSKASYSGVYDNKQIIKWNSGDRVCILMCDDSESQAADYSVKSVNSNSAAVSEAQMCPCSESLEWGTGSHVFYSVYPSPSVEGGNDDSLQKGLFSGHIPAVQNPVEVLSDADGNLTACPDMTFEYMLAKRTVSNPDDDGSVSLSFTPVITAIEFTLVNAFEGKGDMNLQSVSLVSAENVLNGGFNVSLDGLSEDGGVYPSCTDFSVLESSSEAARTLSMNFTQPCVVAYGKTIKLTFFLMSAQDIDDLTLKIVRTEVDEGGQETTICSSAFLSYHNHPVHGDSGIVFARCEKSNLSGIKVPEGDKLFIDSTFNISSWEEK